MRELKFRVWNKRAKVYDEYFELSPKWTQNGDQIIYNKAFIIEQYTGLEDKNGKEIYEGDIVKYVFGNKPIRFDVGRYWLGETLDDLFGAELRYDLEVIGNIHENPELLKEEE